jgi:two-component system, NarL family, nitrate/nitrite response regulator NarL
MSIAVVASNALLPSGIVIQSGRMAQPRRKSGERCGSPTEVMSAKQEKIKVLIVDDHPVVRKGLWSCLSGKPNLKVVGEAADGAEALKKARALKPDIVLLDISMPHMDGMQVAELLRKEADGAKILALSMHCNRDYIQRVIKAGARGYVLKDATPEELTKAIEAVSAGETFFSPSAAHLALNELLHPSDKPSNLGRLSQRERQVLILIAGGGSNKEIAHHLDIGVRTIETHRERIMRKLGIRSVAGLTKFAIAHGLVSLDSTGDGNSGRVA